MMGSKKIVQEKKSSYLILAAVLIVAIVAVFIALNQKGLLVDEEGNIVGEASKFKPTFLNKGDPCSRSPNARMCASGLVCGLSSAGDTCEPKYQDELGNSCITNLECVRSLVCGAEYICEPKNTGLHGDRCVSDLECSSSSPRCASNSGGDSRCRALFISQPAVLNCWCDSLAAEGSACELTNDCRSGLSCLGAAGSKTCQVPGAADGASCVNNADCRSGICVSPQTTTESGQFCTNDYESCEYRGIRGTCQPDNDDNGGSHCQITVSSGPMVCQSQESSGGAREGASCTEHSQCNTGLYCFQGAVCSPKKPDGRGNNCQTPDECLTPHCHFDPGAERGFCGYP